MQAAELPLVWYLGIFIGNRDEWLFGMWKSTPLAGQVVKMWRCGNGCPATKVQNGLLYALTMGIKTLPQLHFQFCLHLPIYRRYDHNPG